MALLLERRIKLEGKIKFDLEFLSGLTLILGDSSTGKTMFFKKYRSICRLENKSNTIFVNKDTMSAGVQIDSILNTKNKVIIIDNADVILPENFGMHIFMDLYNQYIIFGRDTGRYSADGNNIAVLKEENNVISLEYPFSRKR